MKIKTPEEGQLCESLQGRDKGNIYSVVQVLSDSFVLVVDGDRRKLRCPKRKNLKHLALIPENIKDYGVGLPLKETDDCRIAYALKQRRTAAQNKDGR